MSFIIILVQFDYCTNSHLKKKKYSSVLNYNPTTIQIITEYFSIVPYREISGKKIKTRIIGRSEVELEQIEESMFYNQIKLHGMDHSFKKLIEELH